ncbi:hypothetical protein [Halomicrococcus sp. NG-SE-24]|uniref:hypothetical protein n=1 Tax=Halomicrococcus sp. NG-SE-24 TaxID=3436928 RepID=UPI003D99666E
MKGRHAFCPKSGAQLSDEVHYDETGRALRHGVGDDHAAKTQPNGELTNGALRSSKVAIFNYFRRCHQRHRDADSSLYPKAAIALSRLKRAASGDVAWDMYVWLALGERLDQRGFDVHWMNAHVELRCPRCGGRLKFEEVADDGVVATCGTDCTNDDGDHLDEIRQTVVDLYEGAFGTDARDVPMTDELTLL